MAKINVFIDGTWLLVQCAADGSLANATEHPDRRFQLDFSKLSAQLLEHVNKNGGKCDAVGDAYIATSIFTLPDDFDDWPTQFLDITEEQIKKTRRVTTARERFVETAVAGGYLTDAVFRPPIRDYIIRKLSERKYQEKQVDTSVVALLVRSAITKPDDFHVVITGDSDILPAVRVAYPQFTKNVVIATTHPDELNARHRQTAFALVDFDFAIPPYYMQNKQNAVHLLEGAHAYRCEECGLACALQKPIPKNQRPRCFKHRGAKAAA
jgi:hypothetical protein